MPSSEGSGSIGEDKIEFPPEVQDVYARGVRDLSDKDLKEKTDKIRKWLASTGQGDVLPEDISPRNPSYLKDTVQKLVELGAVTAEWEEDKHGNIVKGSLRGNEAEMQKYYKEQEQKRKAQEQAEKEEEAQVDENDTTWMDGTFKYFYAGEELDPRAGLPKWTIKEEKDFWESIKNGIKEEFDALKRPSWKSFDFGLLTDDQREQLLELDKRFSEAGLPPYNPVYDSSDLDSSSKSSASSLESLPTSIDDETFVEKTRNRKPKKHSKNEDDPINLGVTTDEEKKDGNIPVIDSNSDDDDAFLYYDRPPFLPDNITPENKHETIPGFVKELRERREKALEARKKNKAMIKEFLKQEEQASSQKSSSSRGIQVDIGTKNVRGKSQTKVPSKSLSPSKPGPSGISSQRPQGKFSPSKTSQSATKTSKIASKSTTVSKKPSVVVKWIPPKDSKKATGGSTLAKTGDSKKATGESTLAKTGIQSKLKKDIKQNEQSKQPYKPKQALEKDLKPEKPKTALTVESIEYDNTWRKQKNDEWMIVTADKNDPSKKMKHFIKSKAAKKIKHMLANWDQIKKDYEETNFPEEDITEENIDKFIKRCEVEEQTKQTN